jgi:hypothetical protein
MEIPAGKKFDKPDAGMFLGTVTDLVEMPNVPSTYNGVVTMKNKVRIHWVLARMDGTLVVDKEGKPMEIVGIYNASASEKSTLTKRVKQILNGPFPLIVGTDGTEQLAKLLIGRSNVLLLASVENPRDAKDPYINVDGIAPMPEGSKPPAVPTGYIRRKDRPKTQAGPQGTPVQTFAIPQAATAATAPATTPASATQPAPPQSTPTPEQIAAYLASLAAAPAAAAPPTDATFAQPASAKPAKQPF